MPHLTPVESYNLGASDARHAAPCRYPNDSDYCRGYDDARLELDGQTLAGAREWRRQASKKRRATRSYPRAGDEAAPPTYAGGRPPRVEGAQFATADLSGDPPRPSLSHALPSSPRTRQRLALRRIAVALEELIDAMGDEHPVASEGGEMAKLSDTQLIVLSNAAAREDGAAVVPPKMNRAVAAKVGSSLVARKDEA